MINKQELEREILGKINDCLDGLRDLERVIPDDVDKSKIILNLSKSYRALKGDD